MSPWSARIAALATLVAFATPAAAQPPSMDELWPNDDGRSWSYAQHYESFSLDPVTVDNQIRIFFDGTTVAPDGIQTQYLHHQLLSGPALQLTLEGAAGGAMIAAAANDPFLRHLWVARSDLRAKILTALADAPCPQNAPPGSYALLLGGEFAWLKTAGEIAAWRCNLANTRSWRWLVSDLTIGNTFTLQLVPDLASNVFLHGTIAAIEPATVPAGTYNNCVRVDYVIDYGTSECVDGGGVPVGTSRSETRGYVRYAPSVGPVESFEEFIPAVERDGNCPEDPWAVGEVGARTTLVLNSQPVPTRQTSWGRVKQLYRR
jgi:hypothetical protein